MSLNKHLQCMLGPTPFHLKMQQLLSFLLFLDPYQIFLRLLSGLTLADQWAVLVAGSKGFENYAHQVDQTVYLCNASVDSFCLTIIATVKVLHSD